MKVFIIAALTADGFIGRDVDHTSVDWTSPEDSKAYRQITKEAGVMIMGSRTFATINRAMPGRKTIVYTSHPENIAHIEAVEATNEAPDDLLRRLESQGFSQIAICGGSTIYYQFMEAGLVDELYLTVEPIFFGKGIPLFSDKLDIKLQLKEVKHLNEQTIQLIYAVLK